MIGFFGTSVGELRLIREKIAFFCRIWSKSASIPRRAGPKFSTETAGSRYLMSKRANWIDPTVDDDDVDGDHHYYPAQILLSANRLFCLLPASRLPSGLRR